MSEIDITKEDLILFSELPKHLPPQPSGKRIHLSACYRWKSHGLCGVRLATVFVAGNRYTSREAVNRFWRDVTEAKDGQSLEVARRGRKRESNAESELEAAGW